MNEYCPSLQHSCINPTSTKSSKVHMRTRTRTNKSVLGDRTNTDTLFNPKNQYNNLHSHRRSLVGNTMTVKGIRLHQQYLHSLVLGIV